MLHPGLRRSCWRRRSGCTTCEVGGSAGGAAADCHPQQLCVHLACRNILVWSMYASPTMMQQPSCLDRSRRLLCTPAVAAVAMVVAERAVRVPIKHMPLRQLVWHNLQAGRTPRTPEPRCSTPLPALALAPLNTCAMLSIRGAVALAAVAAVALVAFAPLPAAAAVPDPLRLRPPGCNPANCSSCLEYSLHVSSWLCCCEAGTPTRGCTGNCACGAACKGACLASGLVLLAVCHPCMDRLRPQCTGRQHHRHRNQRNCG